MRQRGAQTFFLALSHCFRFYRRFFAGSAGIASFAAKKNLAKESCWKKIQMIPLQYHELMSFSQRRFAFYSAKVHLCKVKYLRERKKVAMASPCSALDSSTRSLFIFPSYRLSENFLFPRFLPNEHLMMMYRSQFATKM